MPEIYGFGQRETDGREMGAATIVVSYPKAVKHVAQQHPTTGVISFRSEPNPHMRGMTLPDLREMQRKLPVEHDLQSFYKDAEKQLIDHIETTPAHKLFAIEGDRIVPSDTLLIRAEAVKVG